jgi:L-2-hydroxyglutarate oxidase LhgO
MEALAADVRGRGVEIRLGCAFTGAREDGIDTDQGPIRGRVVNAAGLHADRVAAAFGFGSNYAIVPFRGAYRVATSGCPLTVPIYPVPDLGFPFLGVHFTVTLDGRVKIGPTALPALWREHYGGLAGFSGRDLVEIGARELRMMMQSDFRRLAAEELRKARPAGLIARALRLADVDPAAFSEASPPGVRAQLVDRRTGRLCMDFVVEGDERSVHVLNAVSPGFTCAPALARVIDG